MPFVRKGKSVFKKEKGKLVKKGSSNSTSKAKAYLRALYANSSK